jgi:hypothetical protein
VDPLPAGATFDKKDGVLTWRPTVEQQGKHEIRLEVSDGRSVSKRSFTFVVRPNQPPKDAGGSVTFFIVKKRSDPSNAAVTLSDDGSGLVLLAQDGDSDDVTFEVRQQPAGARIVASSESVSFAWSPTEGDVGEHELVVDVSDGELKTTIRRKVVVIPQWAAHDYRGWFLLGGGPSAFLTHGDGELFVGGAVDLSLVVLREGGTSPYSCAHGGYSRECHASHHRFYGAFEVLDSLRAGAPSLFTYGIGYSASLEWNPERRYLIPHYGAEVGGLVRSELGHRAQVHPYLGLHLWASDDIWVNAMLGYRVVPAELYDLSGPTFALRVVVNPW